MSVALREWRQLDNEQREAVRALALPPEQEPFAGSMAEAIAVCGHADPAALRGYAVYHAATPVGFFILKAAPATPDWADDGTVTLHAFRIDARQQGRGHARAALATLAELARRDWPATRQLMLSVNMRNLAALGLYLACGWRDTGRQIPGPIGPQHLLDYPL
ncbi:GNAT family N-acetyltransferase [Neisseriaceae bacterium JH1-16]|nr:GNAT family N-acetyltransferase [Neisseriaceae bacterium JH1-16]